MDLSKERRLVNESGCIKRGQTRLRISKKKKKTVSALSRNHRLSTPALSPPSLRISQYPHIPAGFAQFCSHCHCKPSQAPRAFEAPRLFFPSSPSPAYQKSRPRGGYIFFLRAKKWFCRGSTQIHLVSRNRVRLIFFFNNKVFWERRGLAIKKPWVGFRLDGHQRYWVSLSPFEPLRGGRALGGSYKSNESLHSARRKKNSWSERNGTDRFTIHVMRRTPRM